MASMRPCKEEPGGPTSTPSPSHVEATMACRAECSVASTSKVFCRASAVEVDSATFPSSSTIRRKGKGIKTRFTYEQQRQGYDYYFSLPSRLPLLDSATERLGLEPQQACPWLGSRPGPSRLAGSRPRSLHPGISRRRHSALEPLGRGR